MFIDFCLLHKGAVLPRHAIFCTLVFVCLHLILFVSNLCDLLSITILIFFTSNHIISLKQTNLVFGHFDLKFSLRVLLSFCLIFCQFEPGFPYKMLLIKKCIALYKIIIIPFFLGKMASASYLNFL